MPVPEDDLSLLIDAALKAGAVARGFVGATAKRWDKPDNAGPVTEADLAVNDLLLAELRGRRHRLWEVVVPVCTGHSAAGHGRAAGLQRTGHLPLRKDLACAT